MRDTANAWVRDVLNISEIDFGKKRGGAFRNGEFIVPRLVAHKRTRAFYAAALGSIRHDARCQAAAALREMSTRFANLFAGVQPNVVQAALTPPPPPPPAATYNL